MNHLLPWFAPGWSHGRPVPKPTPRLRPWWECARFPWNNFPEIVSKLEKFQELINTSTQIGTPKSGLATFYVSLCDMDWSQNTQSASRNGVSNSCQWSWRIVPRPYPLLLKSHRSLWICFVCGDAIPDLFVVKFHGLRMKSSFLLKSPKNRFSVSNKRSVIKLTGAFYAGNFREWSQSSLVIIIPGNPHSHPFPTFSAGRIQWSEGAGSLGCPTGVARSWNSRVTRKQPTKNWFLVCLFVCLFVTVV